MSHDPENKNLDKLYKKNVTLIKFGYPKTVIKEYMNWVLLLRLEQYTLGSLVLVHKKPTNQLSKISNDASNEYDQIVKEVEHHLSNLFNYDKINYMMLMMKDPVVHYHIIPRYKKSIYFLGNAFIDPDWPGVPTLINNNSLDSNLFNGLRSIMKDEFSLPLKKYNIIYTTGCFDFLHHGHLNILKKSKELTDHLMVGVSTDELIKKEKGKKPTIPFKERAGIVSAIKYVDEVIPQIDKNKQKIVDKYNVNAISVGDDWKGRYPEVTCEIIFFPYTSGVSSKLIKKNHQKK
jgi:glycerol-3-phosphate cytidylyltransferase